MNDDGVVVVGAGIAGLAAATALRRAAPGVDVLVLEAQRRTGGLIDTERTAEGFVIEHGADTLVTMTPWGVAAAIEAGLGDAIVAGGGSRQHYATTGERLVPVPSIFGGLTWNAVRSLLATPLLSASGKLRAGMEPFVRPAGDDDDESVLAFGMRRFGDEFARAVIGPLLGGIHGDDAARLSAEACLPRLRAFEREAGSVIVGVQRAIRARRGRARAGATMLPPTVSLSRGMGCLPDALAGGLGGRLRLDTPVRRVSRLSRARFRVETGRGAITCAGVVLAVPAWQLPPVLDGLSVDLAAGLAAIEYRRLDCVGLAWRRHEVPHALDGTGWVRGADDRRPTLACTWSSQKWPGRVPRGFVLLRSVLSMPESGDADLVAAARRDLRDLLGAVAPPWLTRVRRHPRATPVYAVGHTRRAEALANEARALGAVALAGNAYRGIGVSDCVASGEEAARRVLEAIASQRPTVRARIDSDSAVAATSP